MANIVIGAEAVACENEDCDKTFPPSRYGSRKRFCSAQCKRAVYAEVNPNTSGLRLGHATSGAIAEMVAACDLMRRGYEVFRALSPACSCDLIALSSDGTPLRIEVRSGQRSNVSGNLSFTRNGTTSTKRTEDDLDHYCVVVHRTNEVIYIPPLPESSTALQGAILAPPSSGTSVPTTPTTITPTVGGTPGAPPSPATMTPTPSTSTNVPPTGAASPTAATTGATP